MTAGVDALSVGVGILALCDVVIISGVRAIMRDLESRESGGLAVIQPNTQVVAKIGERTDTTSLAGLLQGVPGLFVFVKVDCPACARLLQYARAGQLAESLSDRELSVVIVLSGGAGDTKEGDLILPVVIDRDYAIARQWKVAVFPQAVITTPDLGRMAEGVVSTIAELRALVMGALSMQMTVPARDGRRAL